MSSAIVFVHVYKQVIPALGWMFSVDTAILGLMAIDTDISGYSLEVKKQRCNGVMTISL